IWSLSIINHIRDYPFSFLDHDLAEPIHVDEPIDFVFHFAALASPEDYLRMPLHSLKVGSYGTHNSLGLSKFKRARFLLASTSEVYGDPQVHPQPETYWGHVNPIGPRGVYDEAKRYAEALAMAYHGQQGVDTAIVRIFNTYGPRMRITGASSEIVLEALRIDDPMQRKPDITRGQQLLGWEPEVTLEEGLSRLLREQGREPITV